MLPILEKIHDSGEYYPTIKEVRKWHGVLNEIIFDGVIPKFYDVAIIHRPQQFAASIPAEDNKKLKRLVYLEIDPSFLDFRKFIIILVHEMIHCWQWVNEGKMTHGKSFFRWRKKLKEHGIPLQTKYHRKFLDIPKEV